MRTAYPNLFLVTRISSKNNIPLNVSLISFLCKCSADVGKFFTQKAVLSAPRKYLMRLLMR